MKLSKLTTIIIVTINGKVLKKVIKNLSNYYKIIIVENNNDQQIKKKFSSKSKSIEVIVSKKNLGFAGGNNLALKKVKTPYVLILNPDVDINKNNIQKLEHQSKKNKNFSILAPNSNHFIQTVNTRLDKIKRYNFIEVDKKKEITEIPWVPGWCMFCKMKDLKQMKYFDDNFFLFFEELDLCKRLKSKNKKFYLMNSNKIIHYFHGTSSNLKEINSINHSKLRLWHYHWSSFYYHRKHYGYINSLRVHISKYLRYTLKKYFSILLGNKKNYILHNSQTRGLLSQMLNKKSFFRVKLR